MAVTAVSEADYGFPSLLPVKVMSFRYECKQEVCPPEVLIPGLVARPVDVLGVAVQHPRVEGVVADAVSNVGQPWQQLRVERLWKRPERPNDHGQ